MTKGLLAQKGKGCLVTGANGFVGKALCGQLAGQGFAVRAVVRSATSQVENAEMVVVGAIDGEICWGAALGGVDVVVHLAARVHVMNDAVADPLAEFRRVNADGTLNLARQAAAAGVRRFIFVSSIKVNGEETALGQPFTEKDPPAPQGDYAVSKWEAEQGLMQLAAATGMEVVVIRPPLVYGPGVKANFLQMMSWLSKGVPLPLGAIGNKRSLVALANLVDLLVACIDHSAAANQTFLVADGDDVSTTELLQRLGKVLGKPARLLAVPSWLIKGLATLVGKRAAVERLLGSLQVDISKAAKLLNWSPPVSMDAALLETAHHIRKSQVK